MDETSQLTIYKEGDVLIINGVEYDFTPLQEGQTLPQAAVGYEGVFAGPITRKDGHVVVILRMPYAYKDEADRSVTFPEPIIDPVDGDIVLPVEYTK